MESNEVTTPLAPEPETDVSETSATAPETALDSTSAVVIPNPAETTAGQELSLFSAMISQNEILVSQNSEILASVNNINGISQHSFVILLVAIVVAVLYKTFFTGGY